MFWHSLATMTSPPGVTSSISCTMSAPRPYFALSPPWPPLDRKPPRLTVPKAPLMTMSPRSLAAEVTCCHWLPAPAVTEEPGMLKEQPCGRKPELNQRWLLRLRVQIESEYGWTDLASSACSD